MSGLYFDPFLALFDSEGLKENKEVINSRRSIALENRNPYVPDEVENNESGRSLVAGQGLPEPLTRVQIPAAAYQSYPSGVRASYRTKGISIENLKFYVEKPRNIDFVIVMYMLGIWNGERWGCPEDYDCPVD